MTFKMRANDNLYDFWRDMPTRWVNVARDINAAAPLTPHNIPVDSPILATRLLITGTGIAGNTNDVMLDILDEYRLEAKGQKNLKYYRNGNGVSASRMLRFIEDMKLGSQMPIHADTDVADEVYIELITTFGRYRHENWNFPAQTLAGQSMLQLDFTFNSTNIALITNPVYRVDVLQYLGNVRTPFTKEFPSPVNEVAAATEINKALPGGYSYSAFFAYISQIVGNYFQTMSITSGSGDAILQKVVYDYFSDGIQYMDMGNIANWLDPDGANMLAMIPPNGVIDGSLYKDIMFLFQRGASTIIEVYSQSVTDLQYLQTTPFEQAKGAQETESLQRSQGTYTSSVPASLSAKTPPRAPLTARQ